MSIPSTQDPNVTTPLAVTLSTARKISGLGYTTLWKLIGDGTLATTRVGRRRLIAYESLRRLVTPDSIVNSASPPPRPGRSRKTLTHMATA